MSVFTNRWRSASVDQRLITISTCAVPGRPPSWFTASAVNRSGDPRVCAIKPHDSTTVAPAHASIARELNVIRHLFTRFEASDFPQLSGLLTLRSDAVVAG